MESFIIEGGHPLSGTITPQGAKNEALEVISATLLTSEPVTISNVPDILDVNNLIQLLKDIGVKVTSERKGVFTFQADQIDLGFLSSDEYIRKCSALRGSVLLMGPLLGRFGKASVAEPGGDKIGRRRLDTHFLGFKNLGAKFISDDERKVFTIEAKHLKGTYMLLDEASVTGTANIIMASVFAEGTTTIYNAACEPYIQQLCHLLNSMGANISGIASNLITIVGVKSLHGAVCVVGNVRRHLLVVARTVSPLHEVTLHLVGGKAYQLVALRSFGKSLEFVEYLEHHVAVMSYGDALHGICHGLGLLHHVVSLADVEGIVDVQTESAHQRQVVP